MMSEGLDLHIHEYVREQIAHADQKAGVLGVAGIGMLGYLVEKGALSITPWMPLGVTVAGVAGALGIGASLLAIGLAFGVLLPRYRGKWASGAPFWGSSAIDPGTSMPEVSCEQLRSHSGALARICKQKFKILSWAFWSLCVALGGTVVFALRN